MSIFRWRGLARPAEDHPEPLPGTFRLPAPELGPNWTTQHGIHDNAFDPTGAPPVAFRKSGDQT